MENVGNIGLNRDIQINQEEIDSALKHFNWGAFGFTWLWGLGNGSFGKTWHILLLEILSAVAMPFAPIISLFALVVRIFYGVNGNKWAYDRRAWFSIEDYTATQRLWAKIVALFFVIFLIFFALAFVIVYMVYIDKH